MQCPTDGTVLVMSERSGIEIDYCPTCRGVWLDRGELDKIIDRSLDVAGRTRRRTGTRRRRRYEQDAATTTGDSDPGPPTALPQEAQGELAQRALRLTRPRPRAYRLCG